MRTGRKRKEIFINIGCKLDICETSSEGEGEE